MKVSTSEKVSSVQDEAPGFCPRLCPRANKNLHIPSGYAQGNLLHNICPQGTPGFCPRLCPRANKNLHIPSGYAQGNLLHNICPQGSIMQIFNPLGQYANFYLPSGYAPGYALGKIRKISKFLKNSRRLLPQAMPQGK
ncbi:hypothetical protein T06_11208 [Trichinella sp. T6]|nr:hypothetical protein T06_11208 [Trichinella sp. T6]